MDKSNNNSINANESVKRVYCKVPVYKKLLNPQSSLQKTIG